MNRRNFIKFTSYLGLSSLGGTYLNNFSFIDIINLKDKIYALSLCNKHNAWISSFDI